MQFAEHGGIWPQSKQQESRLRRGRILSSHLLYEMAALHPMFENKKNTEKLKELLLTDEAARIANKMSNEYKDLTRILVRALQRDPEARYGSAAAFGRDLAALVPDLVRARQELVTFWEQLAELMKKGERALSVGGAVDDESNYTNSYGLAPRKNKNLITIRIGFCSVYAVCTRIIVVYRPQTLFKFIKSTDDHCENKNNGREAERLIRFA